MELLLVALFLIVFVTIVMRISAYLNIGNYPQPFRGILSFAVFALVVSTFALVLFFVAGLI